MTSVAQASPSRNKPVTPTPVPGVAGPANPHHRGVSPSLKKQQQQQQQQQQQPHGPSSQVGGLLMSGHVSRDKDITSIVPSALNCSYAPCFCEENVWMVADHARRNSSPSEMQKCFVIFVSNKKQVVPLWRQKAGKDEEKLVIWDYHVLFIYKPDQRCLVFDLDSDLPFPTYFHKYVTETFRTDAILNPEYHRFFRVIPASLFLQTFASDRRHMKKPDGTWMKPPPPYPCIQTPESAHNLDDFISMDTSVGVGEILSLKEFVQRFYNK
ncbi:hypothetical protein TCAL_11818 [Tigriopus californicus]|uniref:Protein N-terminal glutamine amidohydrolase n=1 Tax=Tigriopus californicus TaxID=6832 RepID=A0A553P712_TIGCA|nr:protein N-terminal glutamine amidohydrolase-like [Tigriopus californicus]TRY73478.1 hypothetical protein TCAL_11818 [Tigriopus californicus]|eukprot:TCALIF_11818-PA protein Name:"Similar to tun Protein N-terminal glutamine amidohydrolase (Anopheles gambiae)" AED:0.27 eAED:0.27 QI:0/-1/0/1/-1/1/1/0/267